MGPGPFSFQDSQLDELCWHWNEAYLISRPEPGVWLAQRRDNRETLRAESAEKLHGLILADYDARPVAR